MTEICLEGLARAAEALGQIHLKLDTADSELLRLVHEIGAAEGRQEEAGAVQTCRRNLAPCLQTMQQMQQVLCQIRQETARTETLLSAPSALSWKPAPLLTPVRLPADRLEEWGLHFEESR